VSQLTIQKQREPEFAAMLDEQLAQTSKGKKKAR
jgi:hypothetical protein